MVWHLQLDHWLGGLTQLTLRHIELDHCSLLAAMLPRLTALESLTLAADASPGFEPDASLGLEPRGGSLLLERPSKLRLSAQVASRRLSSSLGDAAAFRERPCLA